jgi:hypothetical protein
VLCKVQEAFHAVMQDELNQLLGQSLSTEDDEAVAAEMSALEEEELQQQLNKFPKVPETQPAIAQKVTLTMSVW